MKLKLFLVGVIAFVALSILLMTGTIADFLTVVKSFVIFLINFVIGIILIAVGGHLLLFLWNKIARVVFKKKRVKKIYVKKVKIPKLG